MLVDPQPQPKSRQEFRNNEIGQVTITVKNKTFDSSDTNRKDDNKFYTLQENGQEHPKLLNSLTAKVREVVELKRPRPMT